MRVLVTGASGLLGGRLAECLAAEFEVIAGCHGAAVPPGLAACRFDLRSLTETRDALNGVHPDAVLHAAAMANADRCQREPAEAEAINVTASRTLARLCQAAGIRLVALSTDLVFDGLTGRYREDAPPSPILHYGRTKQAGEEAVLHEGPGAAVARVTLIVGRGFGGRPSASEMVAWQLRANQPVRLYTDQFRTPVDPESLARGLGLLLRGSQAGHFHLGGSERLSRFELGLRVARLLRLREDLIEPARQAESDSGVPRPKDVSLDSSRAARELGWEPGPLDDAIRASRITSDVRGA